jgi:hypothetical protein
MSKTTPSPIVDPVKAWRDWFVQSEREWSEALTRLMKEDTTARAVGQEINAALYAQQMMKQGMGGSLAMMNMPTQEQITALGERMGRLEDAVARVEVGLVQLRHLIGGTDAARPRRSRTPPPAAHDGDAALAEKPAARPARKRRS